jgi:hypothetical protein
VSAWCACCLNQAHDDHAHINDKGRNIRRLLGRKPANWTYQQSLSRGRDGACHPHVIVPAAQSTPLLDCPINLRSTSLNAGESTPSRHCRLILPDFLMQGVSLLVRTISWDADCVIRPCSLESLPWISLQFTLYTETIQPHYNLLKRLYTYLKTLGQRCLNSSVLSKMKMIIRLVCIPY